MPGVGPVDSGPLALDGLFVGRVKVSVEAKEDNVLRLRQDPDQIQNIGKSNAGPFGDEGPTLLASLMEDMALGGKPLKCVEKKNRGAGAKAVDFDPPVREATSR